MNKEKIELNLGRIYRMAGHMRDSEVPMDAESTRAVRAIQVWADDAIDDLFEEEERETPFDPVLDSMGSTLSSIIKMAEDVGINLNLSE